MNDHEQLDEQDGPASEVGSCLLLGWSLISFLANSVSLFFLIRSWEWSGGEDYDLMIVALILAYNFGINLMVAFTLTVARHRGAKPSGTRTPILGLGFNMATSLIILVVAFATN